MEDYKCPSQSATIYVGKCIFSFLDPPFFALIRATLGFFVVFPDNSHTLVRVTLIFGFFVLNKSHTLIRVTFGSNESKTIIATWLLFGGGVTPLFDQFFSKIQEIHPTLSPILKKWGTPPLSHSPGGGFPHFSPKFGEYKVWISGTATESCFSGG